MPAPHAYHAAAFNIPEAPASEDDSWCILMNDDTTSDKGNPSMHKAVAILFLVCLAVHVFVYAQSVRYRDVVFDGVEEAGTLRYGRDVDLNGDSVDLLMDFYLPLDDTLRARPALVLAHGGGFVDGDRRQSDIVYLCRRFAIRGYVCTSISYRLGVEPFSIVGFGTAILRSVQDARSAVRFLKLHADSLRIDTSRIVVGGSSAGGVMACHYAFWDSEETEGLVDTTTLGGLEGRGNASGGSSSVAAIINLFGGISDSTWVDSGEAGVVSIHGTEDQTVPFDAGFAFGMPHLPFYGSAVVHRAALRVEVPSVLQGYEGLGHGHTVSSAYMDTTLTVIRDFLYEQLGFGTAAAAPRRVFTTVRSERMRSPYMRVFVGPVPNRSTGSIYLDQLGRSVSGVNPASGAYVGRSTHGSR